MSARPRPLRWQLTQSHLIAIAVTLVAMVGAVVLIAGTWFGRGSDPHQEPARAARTVAESTRGLIIARSSGPDLSATLRAIATGQLELVSLPAAWRGGDSRPEWMGPSLGNLEYLVVVGADGNPIASSDPAGTAFAPPDRPDWAPLATRALAGERDLATLSADRTGSPGALGAYPVLDATGRPVVVVIAATRTGATASAGLTWWRGIVVFGAASIAVLALSSVFAFLSATAVGYLLSRRLVARIERLGHGVEVFAQGNLSGRVEEGPSDEVGQLARRFNAMADRLARTVADLESARSRADSALEAKRELVANVSHELRTPLASIRGHVESLLMREAADAADGAASPPPMRNDVTATHAAPPSRRDDAGTHAQARPGDAARAAHAESGLASGADSSEVGAYLRVIEREADQLGRLIDDLFLLSTAEAGALPLAIEPVDLGGVVEETALALRPIAQRERRITVVAELAPDLPRAQADRQRVAQVLANLVRNALRHTPEGGIIALRARSGDSAVELSVEDTGEGIPPERLPHLFERFYRGDAARDRASGGAGLGLAIVRELVEAMGGEVSVDSTPGQGSRFTVRLPLASTT
jgi:signal transduction histidine kinase